MAVGSRHGLWTGRLSGEVENKAAPRDADSRPFARRNGTAARETQFLTLAVNDARTIVYRDRKSP
jgi:hypothetical protein